MGQYSGGGVTDYAPPEKLGAIRSTIGADGGKSNISAHQVPWGGADVNVDRYTSQLARTPFGYWDRHWSVVVLPPQ